MRTVLFSRVSFAFFVLPFIIFCFTPFFAHGAEVAPQKSASFRGVVLERVPCTNITGYAVRIASTTEPFIFQTGLPKLPIFNPPIIGEEIYGVLSPVVVTCRGSSGGTSFSLSAQRVLYFSRIKGNRASSSTSSPASSSAGSPGVTGGSFSSIFSSIQSAFSSVFSNSSLNSAILGSTGVSAAASGAGGGGGLGIPFGGVVLSPPVPCTAPPGAFMVLLGPPSPGEYTFIPAVTHSYSYGPPLAPGQHVLGKAVPAVCVIGTVTTPTMLILSNGSSLPI